MRGGRGREVRSDSVRTSRTARVLLGLARADQEQSKAHTAARAVCEPCPSALDGGTVIACLRARGWAVRRELCVVRGGGGA